MKTADNDREYVEGQYEANLESLNYWRGKLGAWNRRSPRYRISIDGIREKDTIDSQISEFEWWAIHYSHALKIFEIEVSTDDQEERL